MRTPVLFHHALLLVAAVLAPAQATAAATRPLAVGAVVPDVTLHNAAGVPISLRESVAAKPAVLIFYRGGWCPYCNTHLGALTEIEDELTRTGYQLFAISPDRPDKLYDAPKREAQPRFTLLSDQDATVIDAFGISFVVPDDLVAKYKTSYKIDLEADSGRSHHKLPHPAVYIVDTTGVIRFAHVNEDYKARLEPDKILEAAKAALK